MSRRQYPSDLRPRSERKPRLREAVTHHPHVIPEPEPRPDPLARKPFGWEKPHVS